MTRPLVNYIGIDDGPFPPDHRGDVLLVGTIYTHTRLDGLLTGKARKDGRNATERIAAMIEGSRFNPRLVLLQGIAVGGFNVIDIHGLHERIGYPVLAVVRRRPNLRRIREVLLNRVPGGARKWSLIEKAGPVEPIQGVYVQRVGLTPAQAEQVVRDTAIHGKLPEPLRVAHILAGGIVTGHSHGRA